MPTHKMQQRRGAKTHWQTVNPVLLPGELALEALTENADGSLTYPTDADGNVLMLFKIGDGVSAYNDLPYASGPRGPEPIVVLPASGTSTAGVIRIATNAEVLAGTVADAAVTPAGLDSRRATITHAGIVQLAAPTDFLSDDKAATPATVQNMVTGVGVGNATETTFGTVKYATAADAQAGISARLVISPATLASVTATTARAGVIKLAEAANQTDTTTATTPANVVTLIDTLVPAATTTDVGKMRMATAAEVQTGVLTTTAVSPATLASCTATTVRVGVSRIATSAEVLAAIT